MKIWQKEQVMDIARHVDNVSALIGPIVSDSFTGVQNRLIDEIDQTLHALQTLLFRCPFGSESTRIGVQQNIGSLLGVLDGTMGMLLKTLRGERAIVADPVPSTPSVEPLILVERERPLTIYHPEGHAVA